MLSLLRKYSNRKSVGYRLQQHVTSSMNPRIDTLKCLFLKAVDSVKPKALFESFLHNEYITKQLQIANKRYHVVGFGKAVLGMAVQMERMLGDRLVSGCISIPVGTLQRFKNDADFQLNSTTKINIIECARNNLPDDKAVSAAQTIKSLAERMTSDDVLCVLVSGGGSALLPLPKAPISLEEKLAVIKLLASTGAAIDELNVVRIQLSDVKGGKLAAAANNSHKLLCFIISDIVGDPIPLIASGPTIGSSVNNRDAWSILEKYHLDDKVPQSVAKMLTLPDSEPLKTPGDIHLIGSNELAIDCIINNIPKTEILALPLTSGVQGNVIYLSQAYVELATAIRKFQSKTIEAHNFTKTITQIGKILNLNSKANDIVEFLSANPGKDLLIVAGGEPTVVVKGNGLGGRNQELALRFSLECHRRGESLSDVMLLSAGTDGIDGPTDAAGAIGGADVVKKFLSLGSPKRIEEFLENNDSHSFYRLVDDGGYHIVTGHTGTNVMDIHMLYIPWKR
ncbi:glycerate kinase [Ochlerotatus camptorhynchus]|uniref:glycerate kinase n=1 Tax=Ochlerotatus camptorhynchus TaxID=644619 RepID=UPI0031D3A053